MGVDVAAPGDDLGDVRLPLGGARVAGAAVGHQASGLPNTSEKSPSGAISVAGPLSATGAGPAPAADTSSISPASSPLPSLLIRKRRTRPSPYSTSPVISPPPPPRDIGEAIATALLPRLV